MIAIGPIALLIIVLIFAISVAWTNFVGAPWLPTSLGMVNKMLKLAEVGPDDIVYDLGCGDGRTLITAAWRYKARAVGVEIDPLRYIWCQTLITLLGLRKRVRIHYGNFFKHDLSEATVVTCYLLQSTNSKLEEKLKSELRVGARVVSNTFTFPGLQSVRQDGEARLYTV
jgi:16S rRNA A1518/A1519 N6-dimethyltransferase RsmA/KsgA/DIM1 with predicted DNA glycosylase/AP lyase activity